MPTTRRPGPRPTAATSRPRARTVARRPPARPTRRRRRRKRVNIDLRLVRRWLPVAGVVAFLVAVVIAVSGSAHPTGGLICVDEAGRPIDAGATISGYGADQLANARVIIDAGAAAGAPRHAQVIAVMTAMGESGLRVLDHGDAVGPDSRGLFQQRDNGAWGSFDDRMDAAVSATNFYRALLRLPDWQTLAPTVAAHRVQRNSDENHYAKYWPAADEVVTALTTRSLQCGGGTDEDTGTTG